MIWPPSSQTAVFGEQLSSKSHQPCIRVALESLPSLPSPQSCLRISLCWQLDLTLHSLFICLTMETSHFFVRFASAIFLLCIIIISFAIIAIIIVLSFRHCRIIPKLGFKPHHDQPLTKTQKVNDDELFSYCGNSRLLHLRIVLYLKYYCAYKLI